MKVPFPSMFVIAPHGHGLGQQHQASSLLKLGRPQRSAEDHKDLQMKHAK